MSITKRKPRSGGARGADAAGVKRISISLPAGVSRALDLMVADRRLENRSKAVAEMIARSVLERREGADAGTVMAGIISIVYDEASGRLVQRLFQLERLHLAEVISSLHVQLEHGHRMEVLIAQGPVRILRAITDKILACKGVVSCKLSLTDVLIPPVHAANRVRRRSSR